MTQATPESIPTQAGPVLTLPDEAAQPAWLSALRRSAMTRFDATGFPTPKTEEWRFTPLSAVTQTPFVTADEADIPALQADELSPWLLDADCHLLVCVNGHYVPSLSRWGSGSPKDSAGSLPGVTLGSLREIATREPDRLERWLTHPTRHEDPLTDLNLAMAGDGLVLLVDRGVTLDRPVHLLSISLPQEGRPWMAHNRHLIVLGEGSRAQIVEHHVARDGHGAYWHNDVTQVILEDHAHAEHYLLNEDSPQGVHITTLLATVGSQAHLASHTALFGGQLVRNNIHVELRGRRADALVNGLFVGHGKQTLDNHMRIVHGALDCDSRQFYKGILSNHAHGVFTGRIVVEPEGQKTDAKQTNRNLLLDDTARIHTNPQLEIYADDVKCTHGATTGQLDMDALFYLRSRGIAEHDARAMLIRAFAGQSLHRVTLQPVGHRLERLLDQAMSTALLTTPES